MPNRSRLLAIAITSIVLSFGSARGEQILQARFFSLMNTNVATNFVFDRFNPELGTLTQIIFNLNGQVRGSAGYEYTSTNPSSTPITLTLRASITLTRPNGSTILSSIPLASQIATNVPAFDGVLDFAGTSGKTFDDLRGDTSEGVVSSSAVDLAMFTGTGTIALPIAAIGSSISSGSGNYSTTFTTLASAAVGITYIYRSTPAGQVVPEPTSLALVSCGAVGLLLARRTRRRQS